MGQSKREFTELVNDRIHEKEREWEEEIFRAKLDKCFGSKVGASNSESEESKPQKS